MVDAGPINSLDSPLPKSSKSFTTLVCTKHINLILTNYYFTFCLQALHNCSYDLKRETLILLQIRLRNKSGVDPLRGKFFLQHYTVGLQKNSNDLKYTTVDLEPVSIVHYTRPGSSIKRPTQN